MPDAKVVVIVQRNMRSERTRLMRESQGQKESEFEDVVDLEWNGEIEAGLSILNAYCVMGTIHVFSGYQVCKPVRYLINEAHRRGLRVVEYDEAPCEMCVGVKSLLKRMYYYWVLPNRLRRCTRVVDLFINASGNMGIDRLVRLGWSREKIVPFGYASGAGVGRVEHAKRREGAALRILHSGSEAPYRDVSTARRAVAMLKKRGISAELKCTAGRIGSEVLATLYEWADVFVACGLCEPWGMRVNDAIQAGLPVFVSDGMGAKWIVEQTGCGCVFARGNPMSLADSLTRFANNDEWRKSLYEGVAAAHKAWTPEARARFFLKAIGV